MKVIPVIYKIHPVINFCFSLFVFAFVWSAEYAAIVLALDEGLNFQHRCGCGEPELL